MRILYLLASLALTAAGCSDKAPSPKPTPPMTETGGTSAQSLDAGTARTVRAMETVGTVRVTSEGGGSKVLQKGEVIFARSTITTGPDDRATLSVDDITLVIEEKSTLTTGSHKGATVEFQLESGRVRAEAQGGGSGVRVRSTGSSAVAETNKGGFAVFNDGHGMVAVAASAGEVKLSSTGGDAILAGGEKATVTNDAAPVRGRVPREVLLKVVWPGAKRKVTLRGSAEPGTVVQINGGGPVAVGADGRFETELKLKQGRNPIEVEAVDLSGRKRTVRRVVKIREGAPRVQADTKKLWN